MTTRWLEHAQEHSDIEGFRLIGHSDLGGHGDGFQVIRRDELLYVAHLGTSPMALSVLDVSDPADPRLLHQIEHPRNTRCHKVQVAGNLLIQNNELPYWAKGADPAPITGLTVYTLDDPTQPRPVGFHPASGVGTHRLWFSEPPLAHISSVLPGGSVQSYEIVDLSDPMNPASVGSWSVPGTFPDDVDTWTRAEDQPQDGVHGVIPHGDRAYAACFDAGMAVLDISDPSTPQLISHISWSPPFGGFAHTTLPLPARGLVVASSEAVPRTLQGGDKRIWLIDVTQETHPVTFATFPDPRPPARHGVSSYHDLPGVFGPHNLHENRPGSYISEETIFATYSNAGLRVFDISDKYAPREKGYFVPPPAEGQEWSAMNDLYVDAEGIVFVTDRLGGGLYILQYVGR
ncbi:LVIVD repeat-containing protein [Microbacterium aurantiacum]|uniref:LVIVD repeat-containing protein n=1 Tax=Microbacterium aurantiacum TaxID=162393 RepID=A0AAJ2HF18_9MICO|nr:hypothetical protein [Microbacterium aurantiacum]MDS0244297.1 hypothetical protein [Microbacterium aurantiacum]